MSETIEANQHQNTPSAAELEAQIAADEAARQVVEEPEQEAPPEPESEPEKEEDEFDKRISRMAYEKRQAEKQAKQLREEIERLRGERPALPQDQEVERLVQERATQLAAVQSFNDRANAIYKAGCAEFADFEQRLIQLREVGITPGLVEAAEEVGDPHKLLHYLAKNLDEAETIVNMPPHKMGVALGKIATKLAAPKPQSKAPAPITPISGRGGVEQSIEDSVRDGGNMGPIDAWIKKEDERWAQKRWRR